jgi:hypothetical protein
MEVGSWNAECERGKDACGRGKYSISDCGMDKAKICVDDKIINSYLPLKNQHSNIPPFHFSMIGARTQASNNIIYIH